MSDAIGKIEQLTTRPAAGASGLKGVVIPRKDLDKLEEARLALYALFPDANVDLLVRLQHISDPMWMLTHKRYPEV